MDSTIIKSAARKALMAAEPHYQAWPPAQQERFRATMNESAENRIDAVLLQELMGISCSPEEAREIWKNVPLTELDPLNWAKLLTTGIGEDGIWLNESMAEGTSLLDFDTVYDYDFADHLFQEQANKREFSDYQGREYCALRFSSWARLIIEDQFFYATLYSLAGYLTTRLEDNGHDLIQTLIPHDYVEGNAHGKQEEGGFRWDMQVDAGGQEKQLDELTGRWHQYLQQRWEELSQGNADLCCHCEEPGDEAISKLLIGRDKDCFATLAQAAPVVFMQDIEEHGEHHRNFIFNNQDAVKQVRWRYFLADCAKLQADSAEIAALEKQEWQKARAWLEETHQDIMQNFDPDVIRLKRKRRIVVAPGAFDGLVDGEDDESE